MPQDKKQKLINETPKKGFNWVLGYVEGKPIPGKNHGVKEGVLSIQTLKRIQG